MHFSKKTPRQKEIVVDEVDAPSSQELFNKQKFLLSSPKFVKICESIVKVSLKSQGEDDQETLKGDQETLKISS